MFMDICIIIDFSCHTDIAVVGFKPCAEPLVSTEAKRQHVDEDPEKIYNYRYCTNASVFKFLMGDKEGAVEILKSCPIINDSIPDYIYMRKKLELLKNVLENKEVECKDNFLYLLREHSCNETG